MKITIEGTQEEFDEKRPELLKSLGGSAFDVEVTDKGGRKKVDSPKQHSHKVMRDLIRDWNTKYQETLEQIKKDIHDVIHSS